MRIAQVAPLYESIPPRGYGGTERVVSYLTEELVRQGHDVTLFASGDSITNARLVPVRERSMRLDPTTVDPLADHILELQQVVGRAREFDVIHWHLDYLHFPLSRLSRHPHVTTLHGRLDLPDLVPLYREFADMPVVSISDAQRAPLPWINWKRTIHHGLPQDLYQARETPGDYLAFVGRISPEKRLDRAIDIARRTGIPLKVAAKVDKVDRDYFAAVIEPMLDPAFVEFIGEIGDSDKNQFLGQAMALLFPIDWPEPFGLVMIEALACGTPVIGYERASVPEVIDDGESGFLVTSIDQACRAVERLPELSRRRCRELFDQRFTARRMAQNYVGLYADLLAEARPIGKITASQAQTLKGDAA